MKKEEMVKGIELQINDMELLIENNETTMFKQVTQHRQMDLQNKDLSERIIMLKNLLKEGN